LSCKFFSVYRKRAELYGGNEKETE